MVKNKQRLSKMTFFIDKEQCLHVQGKTDSRYGKEWTAEDFDIEYYSAYVSGQLTEVEISFFESEDYPPIEQNTTLGLVKDLLPYYKCNFDTKAELKITNSKLVSEIDKNWTPIQILGTICLPCEDIMD